MNDDTLRETLRDAPTLVLDAAFADRLESRLRADASVDTPIAELQAPRTFRRARRRIALAAVLVAAVIATTVLIVRRGPNTSRAAGVRTVVGYRFATTMVVTHTPGRAASDGARIDGAVDVVDGTMQMTVADPSGRHPAQHYILTATAKYTPVADWRVQIGLRTNAAQERILAGKHWVRDRQTTAPDRFTVDGLFVNPPLIAKYDVLAKLRAAGVEPLQIGTERIRGTDARHYRFRRDRPVHYDTGTRTTHIVVDLWIDKSGHLLRLRARDDIPETNDSAPERIDSTTDYFNLAQPPPIAVPAADDSADGGRLEALRYCGADTLSPPVRLCDPKR